MEFITRTPSAGEVSRARVCLGGLEPLPCCRQVYVTSIRGEVHGVRVERATGGPATTWQAETASEPNRTRAVSRTPQMHGRGRADLGSAGYDC